MTIAQIQRDGFRAAHRAGVKMVFASDAGVMPHAEVGKQFRVMVEYGMTPMEAIRSATVYGGQIMLQGHELGAVKEGYLADLLLVDGDPLANIAVLQDQDRILAVMKDGQFYKTPDVRAGRSRLGLTAA